MRKHSAGTIGATREERERERGSRDRGFSRKRNIKKTPGSPGGSNKKRTSKATNPNKPGETNSCSSIRSNVNQDQSVFNVASQAGSFSVTRHGENSFGVSGLR